MDFASLLSQYDNDFDSAEALGGTHPEGRHTGEVTVARIEQPWISSNGDDTVTLSIHVKTDKGTAFANLRLSNFSSEKAMGFTKGQLANLGHSGKLSEVPNLVHEILGSTVEIDVDHNSYTNSQGEEKTGVNVYFRKLISSGDASVNAFGGFAPDMEAAPAAPAAAFPAPAGSPMQAAEQAQAPAQAVPAAPAAPAAAPASAPAAPPALPFG